eukprot:3667925-Pleurochrysis_carterae.AAC.1
MPCPHAPNPLGIHHPQPSTAAPACQSRGCRRGRYPCLTHCRHSLSPDSPVLSQGFPGLFRGSLSKRAHCYYARCRP